MPFPSSCPHCGTPCFVDRVMPADARAQPCEPVVLAACPAGRAADRDHFGYDATTAIHPFRPLLIEAGDRPGRPCIARTSSAIGYWAAVLPADPSPGVDPTRLRPSATPDLAWLRDLVVELLNPPGGATHGVSGLGDLFTDLVDHVAGQPCRCPSVVATDQDACDRCRVLGRRRDVPTER